MERRFSFHAQVRERILPALAELDGLTERLPEILQHFDTLAGRDLDFDLRGDPPFPSNLCEQNCALELAYTFGGQDDCGVRYSFEPTRAPGRLSNRYTLCRDRVRQAMSSAGDGYDASLFRRLFKLGLPNDILLGAGDTTASICAIHHYRTRPPRLKIYFSVDYADGARALEQIRNLVAALDDERVAAQTEAFLRAFEPAGGGRMVGFDFEPGRPVGVKVYKEGVGLSAARFDELVEQTGSDDAGQRGIAAFRDTFLPAGGGPDAFNLVTLAANPGGAPRLKLYIRPVDLYDDGETLARLRRWYAEIGHESELELVEQGLAAVAPLDVLAHTRGFFNYLSVDVGESGVSKTSVYFAPLIPLTHLALVDVERLPDILA